MFTLKECVFVLLFLLSSVLALKISTQNDSADFLRKLYNLAIQSSQTNTPYAGKYSGYYQYPNSAYPIYNKKYQYNPSYYPPVSHFQNPSESIMDILYSITKNDDLQCVPKLICEVTSGTISGRQSGLNLPVNVNMESLVGFLSTLNGAQSSPLLYFGKAALLGFSSKGNARSCNYAYPECPSDPDKVVNYLNNHNGGFFRFFSGSAMHNYAQNYEHQIPYSGKQIAEQRIQNNVVENRPDNFNYENEITFPKDYVGVNNYDYLETVRSQKALKFPSSNYISDNEINQHTDSFYPYNSLTFPREESSEHKPFDPPFYNYDFQKPLPNHKASPMIFPDRTGTGDLKLDPEEFRDYRPIYYQDENVRIVVNDDNSDKNNYALKNVRYGRGFNFPV